MLKNVFLTLLSLAIAVIGGGGSVWYMLDAQESFDAIHIGAWTAFPDIGAADADPYSKARIARAGVLALGRAEGLAFTADRDSSGEPLRRECAYSIEGGFPIARFWTLYAADQSLDLIATGKARPAALHSYQILRKDDNSAIVAASRHPAPGNWLPIWGSGSLYLVLTFYDTPIANGAALSDLVLPQIRKAACDA